MLRTAMATLAIIAVFATKGWAQPSVGPGSTVQGDYLRGVGVAAWGLGELEKSSAVAQSINVNTAIVWNEYVSAVLKNENREKALHRAALFSRRMENYNKIRQRIRESPEERDVMNGDALNAVLQDLLDPKIQESAIRYAPVPLSVDTVRRIPFKLDAEGMRFSMQRLAAQGKWKWPVALQDDRFASSRKAYERALDTALEQQIEAKMSTAAIDALKTAVDNLFAKLDEVVRPSSERHYLEAKNYLADLRKAVELIKSHKIERVLVELDEYPGTTVNDLRLFMQRHNLRFAFALTPEERTLYPDLYAALIQQRELVMPQVKERKK